MALIRGTAWIRRARRRSRVRLSRDGLRFPVRTRKGYWPWTRQQTERDIGSALTRSCANHHHHGGIATVILAWCPSPSSSWAWVTQGRASQTRETARTPSAHERSEDAARSPALREEACAPCWWVTAREDFRWSRSYRLAAPPAKKLLSGIL